MKEQRPSLDGVTGASLEELVPLINHCWAQERNDRDVTVTSHDVTVL